MSGKVDENGGRRPDSPERDAMLDDPEPRKQRPGCLSRTTDALGLSVRWLLVLVVLAVLALVLLAAVITLAANWPSPPPEVVSTRCESSDCLRAAAQLQSGTVGGDALACDAFWQYSCDTWMEDNPIPSTQSEWGVTPQILYSAEERLQRILSTLPYAESPRSYLWKLNALYMGCMDRAQHPDRSDLKTKLSDIISSLGGFDALGLFERQLWNPSAVIRQLHAEHNIDVFFKIDVITDPDNSSVNVIQISPGGVGLPERGYYFRDVDDGMVTAYQRYIQDVLLRLGVPVDRAGRFAKNMFHYEKRLMEASVEPLQLRDTAARPPRRVTVDWLRKESPQIEWLNTLRAVYPAGKITMETEIVLPDDAYIVEVSKIVSSTATSSMNEYLMWRLVDGYMPYLPEADRAALDVLRAELTGVRQRPPHWLSCTRITRELLPLAAGALLVRDEPAPVRERSRRAADDLFLTLQQGLGGALTYTRFVSDRNRAAVMQQISSVVLYSGYPAVLLDDKLLDKVYSEMSVMRHSFFDSVQAARQHQRVVQQKAYLAPGQDQELEPLFNGPAVTYDRPHHAIVIPDQLLRPPLFDPSFPPPFQYGGLGTQLAEALLSSIEPESLLASASSNFTSDSGSEDTMANNRAKFRACVSGALAASQVQERTVERVTASAADQVLAVRLALQTMKSHLEEVGDEELPGLEDMTSEKVFFVAYGQSLCLHKTEAKAEWDEFSRYQVDGKVKLHLTVEQAAPFREAFHCNETHAHVLKGPCGFFV